jgi:multisubunit Na+/H+ antiporter MnhC subunit
MDFLTIVLLVIFGPILFLLSLAILRFAISFSIISWALIFASFGSSSAKEFLEKAFKHKEPK